LPRTKFLPTKVVSKLIMNIQEKIDPFSIDQEFSENPLMSMIKLARFKFAAKMLSTDDIVLDLGCGNGFSSYFFSFYAKEVLGVDLYSDIPAASERFVADNLCFIKEDILTPSSRITSKRFTVVTAIDVIEHFYREDGEKIIRNYSELLTDNGMMVIGTPNKFSKMYRSEKSKQVHFYEYEPDELKKLCDRYFGRTILFSMNDELVHTGFNKLAWFLFILCFK